ncbi:hypothetical protein H6G36_30585 [Anabaena minutissima FACHB-250]|nr:hypothetical protein [Anabaena minutissima FACHB-250]
MGSSHKIALLPTINPTRMNGTDDVGVMGVEEAAIALWDFHSTSVPLLFPLRILGDRR